MGAQEGKLLRRKGKSTVKVCVNLTEADYKVFQQFQTYVIKKHGKLRGAIGHELAKALKQYLKRNQKSPQAPEVTENAEEKPTNTETTKPTPHDLELVIEVGGKRFTLKEHEWQFIKEEIVEKATSPYIITLVLKSPKRFLPLLQAMINANAICYDTREGRCKIDENALKITYLK
jgi:hypothetical protein